MAFAGTPIITHFYNRAFYRNDVRKRPRCLSMATDIPSRSNDDRKRRECIHSESDPSIKAFSWRITRGNCQRTRIGEFQRIPRPRFNGANKKGAWSRALEKLITHTTRRACDYSAARFVIQSRAVPFFHAKWEGKLLNSHHLYNGRRTRSSARDPDLAGCKSSVGFGPARPSDTINYPALKLPRICLLYYHSRVSF